MPEALIDCNWSLLVQSNWEECWLKEDGEFWVTFKELGRQGDHDKIKKDGNQIISKEEKFDVLEVTSGVLKLTHRQTKSTSYILAPVDYFSNILGGTKVSRIDVSSGGLGVVAGNTNSPCVWDTQNGTVRRVLSGHVGEVYSARLFPSGVVVLTAGADMQLKIWSAQDGSCPVTLTGHTQAIMDTAIVERGKNVISVSRDGTARLWNCGEKKCVSVLASFEDQLNCCCIGENTVFQPKSKPTSHDDGEIGTEGKVLAVGGEGGRVTVLDVASRTTIFDANLESAVNCLTFTSIGLYVGCQNGKVHLLTPKGEIFVLTSSFSPVLSLLPVSDFVGVARQDGSVTLHKGEKRLDLTGSDTDPVYSLAQDNKWIYTACRDGSVRKYDVDAIKEIMGCN